MGVPEATVHPDPSAPCPQPVTPGRSSDQAIGFFMQEITDKPQVPLFLPRQLLPQLWGPQGGPAGSIPIIVQAGPRSLGGKAGTGGLAWGQPLRLGGGKWEVSGRGSSPFAGDTRSAGPGDTGLAELIMGMVMAPWPRAGMASPPGCPLGLAGWEGPVQILRRETLHPQCCWLLPLGSTAVPLRASVSPAGELRRRPRAPSFPASSEGFGSAF